MNPFDRRSFLGWSAGAAMLSSGSPSASEASDLPKSVRGDGPLPWIDCREYGAAPGDGDDAGPGLTRAYAAAVSARQPLYLPAGIYRVITPVPWIGSQGADIFARGASIHYYGTTFPAVTYGGVGGQFVDGVRVDGLSVHNRMEIAGVGLMLTNIKNATVELEQVARFDKGIHLYGNRQGLAYTRLRVLVQGCRCALYASVNGKKGWINRLTIFDARLGPAIAAAGQAAVAVEVDPACFAMGWIWQNCAFECAAGSRTTLLEGDHLRNWVFQDCWFECSDGKPMALGQSDDRSITFRGGVLVGLAIPTPAPQGIKVVD